MSTSQMFELATILVGGILVIAGVIRIAALRAERERYERRGSSSGAERVRLRNQEASARGSPEGETGKADVRDRKPFFLLLLACSLGFVCWIGGSCGISESCFAHGGINTAAREFAWLCAGPLIVLISWAVPVLAYRKLGRPLVLVLGAGFTVLFILVGFGVLVELLDCF